jgi:hypothetical protein
VWWRLFNIAYLFVDACSCIRRGTCNVLSPYEIYKRYYLYVNYVFMFSCIYVRLRLACVCLCVCADCGLLRC